MWIYLLKFSACLALLLLFYKWVLEKVHIHHFKRYYLLSAFIISLSIPLITFTQYVTVTIEPTLLPTYIDQSSSNSIENKNNTTQILPISLWGIYALGVFIFALKFLGNLKSLIKNIKSNPKLKSGRIHHVLLQELIAPHTFFSYIFFNKKNYEAHKIPQEVFWHEETHARQKHSLDILLLELIQIVFWFHPLIYWAKHLAKLNHEFLADQAVLKRGASVPNYQKMVLAFSSSDSYRNAVTPPLANAIHYSSIKKRIVIMKTQTSKKAIWLRSLLLIPLMSLLLYSFSTKEVLEIQKMESVTIERGYQQEVIEKGNELEVIYDSKIQNITTDEIVVAINKNGQLLFNLDLVTLEELKSHLLRYNQGLTKEQRSQSVKAIIRVAKETPAKIIKQVDAILMDYGVATIDIQGPTGHQNQVGATKSEIQEFNTLAKKYNAQPQDTRVIPLKDLKTLENIYGSMTDDQKEQAEPFPECPTVPQTPKAPERTIKPNQTIPPPPPPYAVPNAEKHSKALLESFEKFDKKANTYGKATEAFTKKGEGTLANLQTLYEETMVLYNSYVELAVKEDLMKPTPPKAKEDSGLPSSKDSKEESSNMSPSLGSTFPAKDTKASGTPQKVLVTEKSVSGPSHHANPFIHISYMQSKNAIFYLEEKKITSEEAWELVKRGKNRNISMITKYPEVNQPIVYLSLKSTESEGKKINYTKVDTVVTSDLPPPPPTIATHVNTENYSKELKNAIYNYLRKAKSYRTAVSSYHNEHKGSLDELKKNHVEVMQLYNAYKKLAYKENHYVHPVPLYNDPKGEFGEPNSPLKVDEEITPSPTLKSSDNQKQKLNKEPSVYYGILYNLPQLPPQPHPNPVQYIKELAEKGATFYIGPHQYKTAEAIELVRKSKNASIDVSDYPVVKLGGC